MTPSPLFFVNLQVIATFTENIDNMRTQDKNSTLDCGGAETRTIASVSGPLVMNNEENDTLSEYISGTTLLSRLQPRIKAMFE